MIVKCRECGKDISDEAQSCPFCGCPKESISEQSKLLENIKKIKRYRSFFIAGTIIELLFVVVSFWAVTQQSKIGVVYLLISSVLFICFAVLAVFETHKLKEFMKSAGDYVKNELQASKGKRSGISIFFAILLILIGCLLAYSSSYNIGYH